MSDENKPANGGTPAQRRTPSPSQRAAAASAATFQPPQQPRAAGPMPQPPAPPMPPAPHSDTNSGDDATTKQRSKVIHKPRRTRKARLRLSQIDPWSAMKTTFLFSFAFLLAGLAAVSMLYIVIDAAGLFDSINQMAAEVLGTKEGESQFHIQSILSFGRVVGFTALVGALNVVLLTTIGTLGAFLYNLSATILGGLEVTLAED